MKQSKILHDFIRAYKYGDSHVKVVYYKCLYQNPPRKFSDGVLENIASEFEKLPEPMKERLSSERFDSSISRTRAAIMEIALCNPFEWFCTFTVSADLRDRFNLDEFRADLSRFIRNQNRYRDDSRKIEFLLIPEQHKDGAWHMHGLLRGLDDSDLTLNEHGHLDWVKYRSRFGFFSCSKIKSHEACSRYITKYVSKSLFETKIQNHGHMYFASKGLKRKECISIDESPCDYDNWDFENDYVKIKWIKTS